MRARTSFIIDAIIMVAYAVATNPMTTGTPVHEWLSIGVAVVAFAHLVLHWDWTVSAVRRFFGTLNATSRVNLAVDLGLLLAGVTVAMSGLLVSRSALSIVGYAVSDSSVWHRIHSESTTVLLALVGLHVGLHWDWATSVLRNQIIKQLFARKASARAAGAAVRRVPVRSGPQRAGFRSALVRTAGALALVGLIAWGVWKTAPGVEAGLAWLVLPGQAQIIERAEAASASTPTTITAAHFEGSTAERVLVRTSHSLLVIVIAALAGSATAGALKRH